MNATPGVRRGTRGAAVELEESSPGPVRVAAAEALGNGHLASPGGTSSVASLPPDCRCLRSPSTPMTARGQACTGVLPAGCALERRTRPHARGRGLAGRPREREGGRLFRTVARPRRAIEVLRVSWAAGRRRRCRCLPSTCSDDASPERLAWTEVKSQVCWAGITPSCCICEKTSTSAHTSATRRSAKRMTMTSSYVMDLPVA
jgi:hypothetical protein